MPPRDFGDWAVGDSASLEHEITSADVARFVDLTGDDNPVHVDDDYASSLGLPARVAHGMLTSGFVSTVIGTKLPGPGALWISERFNFRAPVFVGDRIRVEARIRRISPATRVLVLDIDVRNGKGTVVLDGEAQVHVLEEPKDMTGERRGAATAVITGSGKGIGAAVARRLAADGVHVVVNYRSDEARALQTAEAIAAAGGTASLFRADVSEPDGASALIAHATETHGPVDALINNAGTPPDPRALPDLEWADMERHLHGHLRASFLCVQAVLPGMIERRFGRIVSLSSQAAYGAPPPKMHGYAVAKAALAAFTRGIAQEGGPHGVTANVVAPGMTNTDMVGDVSPRAKAVLASQMPLRRLPEVEDVADAIAFLVGPAGGYVTGQTLHLSGGQVMT